MFLVSSCSCLCPIQWSQVSSWEWRCQLEQRQQAMLQLHLSDRQFYCLLRRARDLTVSYTVHNTTHCEIRRKLKRRKHLFRAVHMYNNHISDVDSKEICYILKVKCTHTYQKLIHLRCHVSRKVLHPSNSDSVLSQAAVYLHELLSALGNGELGGGEPSLILPADSSSVDSEVTERRSGFWKIITTICHYIFLEIRQSFCFNE